jgi:hypothetical protein
VTSGWLSSITKSSSNRLTRKANVSNVEGEPEAYKEQDLRSIAISPRERLERIEKGIDQVLSKLDTKADAASVIAVAVRVAALEQNVAVAAQSSIDAHASRERMETEVDNLRQEHVKLGRKVAYYAGGLAMFGVFGEVLFWLMKK